MAIGYLEQKYGREFISQIITFGKYKLKNITKAVMSALGCDFQEANNITKGIPDLVDGNTAVTYDLIEEVAKNPDDAKFVNYSSQEKTSLTKAYDRLQDCFKKYPMVYDAIVHLTGCINSVGVHAGGVIICRYPIHDHGAVIVNKGSAFLPVIQFEMNDLDFFGFLKVDALGLGTLDVIKTAMDLIGLDNDWYDSEDFDDPNIYKMLKAGQTTDIFQFSSPMPTRMIREFDCTSLLDLSAVNAGNRPGPLEKDKVTGKSMVDLYAERRETGLIPSTNPRIDPILQKTMGVILFQEQCIFIGQEMAGYNLGNADLRVRKPLCKKKKKVIPEIRNEFIYGKKSLYDEDHNVIGMSDEDSEYCEGAIARGFTETEATHMFDSIEAFAKYAFNQSHSGCYAMIGYKEAWISYYHPVEFTIANCTVNDDFDDIRKSLAMARKRKIQILGPDINESRDSFSPVMHNGEKSIRYGLKAIKCIGPAVITFLLELIKRHNKPFTSFDDFYQVAHNSSIADKIMAEIRQKTKKKTPNPLKKDVEVALILAGCFDCFEPNRHKLYNYYMGTIRKDKTLTLKDEKKYSRKDKLAYEKEYMGDYISEHPLDPFVYADIDACADGEFVETAAIVQKAVMKETKTRKKYIRLTLMTKDGIERTVNMFNENKSLSLKKDIKKNQIVVFKGTVSKQFNNISASSVKILANNKQLNNVEALTIDDLTTQIQPPVVTSEKDSVTLPSINQLFDGIDTPNS